MCTVRVDMFLWQIVTRIWEVAAAVDRMLCLCKRIEFKAADLSPAGLRTRHAWMYACMPSRAVVGPFNPFDFSQCEVDFLRPLLEMSDRKSVPLITTMDYFILHEKYVIGGVE